MNYYPFHIGDYSAHTAHLEPMEDLAYRRLLDQYYLHDGPLPADIQVTAKLIRMRSMAADVESVLKEFFTLTNEGWRHERCDDELCRMMDKQVKAKASAAASVKSRQASAYVKTQTRSTSVDESINERSTNVEKTQTSVELPTPTPTPIKNTKNTSAVAPPDGVGVSVWADFVELRKSKKAKLTQTAIDGLQREADKAGWTMDAAIRECCSRGWAGFKAEWVAKAAPKTPSQPTSFKSQDDANARSRWEQMTGETHPDNLPKQAHNVIDFIPQLLEIAQ